MSLPVRAAIARGVKPPLPALECAAPYLVRVGARAGARARVGARVRARAGARVRAEHL